MELYPKTGGGGGGDTAAHITTGEGDGGDGRVTA